MASEYNNEQLKRRVILLEDKMNILNRIKNGEKVAFVAKSLNLSISTINTIKRNESKIRQSVAKGHINGGNVTRKRDINLIKMESALIIWFENCIKKKIPLSGDIIQQKALKIYNYLNEMGHFSTEQPNKSFTASSRWLHHFKTRYNLHNIKLQGEQASADPEAADKFKQEIQEIIEKGGYCEDQIFNVDEIALHWKKLPPRTTYIFKNQYRVPGFKACKEHITLFFCSNVAGNCLLKPLLVDKNTIFKKWFFDCFVPSVENHMQKQNRSFKALLIVDKAVCRVKDLNHPNIRILFLPPNCTSLIQPLDQGIIHAFKTIYTRLLFQTIFEKLEIDDNKTLIKVWKEFSIKDCINIISLACKELKTSTLNACWKPLLPQMVKDENVIPSADEEYDRIINVASRFDTKGLSDLNIQDVEEMLTERSLNEEELIELVDEYTIVNTLIDNNAENNESSPNINFNGIEMIINSLEQIQHDILEYDPLILRSAKYRRELQKFIISYQEFLAVIKSDKVPVTAINSNPI